MQKEGNSAEMKVMAPEINSRTVISSKNKGISEHGCCS